MHIPLTVGEIARHLEVPRALIDDLWASGKLKRTLACSERIEPSLGWSTIFDVLEYSLSIGKRGTYLSKCIAETWVAELCAILDYQDDPPTASELCEILNSSAIELDLATQDEEGNLIAEKIVREYYDLIRLCQIVDAWA